MHGHMKVKFIENYWNTKFHENPSSGSRAVPWEQTFLDFAKHLKNRQNLVAHVATSCKFYIMRLTLLELLPRQTTML
jgi:hypothetical protein